MNKKYGMLWYVDLHEGRFAFDNLVHFSVEVARLLLETLCSMGMLISCAISSHIFPNAGFISSPSCIVIPA